MHGSVRGLELLRVASERAFAQPSTSSSSNSAAAPAMPAKRGRRPTPGLTPDQRHQLRLLKNRRTAKTSRARKRALILALRDECAKANARAARLAAENARLRARLRTSAAV